MTLKKSTISVWMLSLSLIGLLFWGSLSAMPSSPSTTGGPFILGKAGQALSQGVKSKLAKAYKAQFGQKAKIDRIEVVKHKGKSWLAIQSGGKSSPTIAIQLKVVDGKWVLVSNAVTNTCAGDPCSWCYFDSNHGCKCNGADGGKCNHTQTGLKGHDQFLEVLSM